jgi:hypothetical protein
MARADKLKMIRPLPRYGLPPYLISLELGEGLIPFPYLVRTVCIPPIPQRFGAELVERLVLRGTLKFSREIMR